jgi:putative N6-adenine-specific DNA methylase
MRLFATAAKGTEPAVRDELRELGFHGVRADRGGVHFEGSLVEGARACLELRTAVRVLWLLAELEAPDAQALYEGVAAQPLEEVLGPEHTLAVRAFARDSALTHTQFIAQRTKDAIVDRLRARCGARPTVDLADADVVFFVHLKRDRAQLYLDLAGEPLHRRGYRARAGTAPLKETLAASLLRLSGWDRSRPLLNPMCGSGTLAIEAALWAHRIAPGLARTRLGLERWRSHDAAAARQLAELREATRARALTAAPPIVASDVDPQALAQARQGARRAGVRVQVEQRSIVDLTPTSPPGHVIINPPYGERIEVEAGLYREIARALAPLSGHRIAVLAGGRAVGRALPRRPDRWVSVFNGPIECRLLVADIP